MEVAGLPVALRVSLEAILVENAVSSWKIVYEGTSTVLVLRLNEKSQASNGGATPVSQFRKKTPSQIRRDRRRAEQRAAKKEERSQTNKNQASVLLNMSTSKDSATRNRFAIDRHSLIVPSSDTDNDIKPNHEAKQASSLRVSRNSRDLSPIDSSSLHTTTSECGSAREASYANNNTELACMADTSDSRLESICDTFRCEDGQLVFDHFQHYYGESFDFHEFNHEPDKTEHGKETVQYKVHGVFDKQKLKVLRDSDRNQNLLQVVPDPQNSDLVYCESEDFMLIYDCTSQSVIHWYIQHCSQGKLWSQTELKAWNCLHRSPSPHPDQYDDIPVMERLTHELRAIAADVRNAIDCQDSR